MLETIVQHHDWILPYYKSVNGGLHQQPAWSWLSSADNQTHWYELQEEDSANFYLCNRKCWMIWLCNSDKHISPLSKLL